MRGHGSKLLSVTQTTQEKEEEKGEGDQEEEEKEETVGPDQMWGLPIP
jgi:hypothetical protein